MVKLVAFVAPSGSGKTTLIEGVTRILSDRGLRVGVIKHGHHAPDMDRPGKDTDRYRQAGAGAVAYVTKDQWFLSQRLENTEGMLDRLLSFLDDYDMLLLEGYKSLDLPKILVHRQAVPFDVGRFHLGQVIGIASDGAILPELECARLNLNNHAAVADFITDYFNLTAMG